MPEHSLAKFAEMAKEKMYFPVFVQCSTSLLSESSLETEGPRRACMIAETGWGALSVLPAVDVVLYSLSAIPRDCVTCVSDMGPDR